MEIKDGEVYRWAPNGEAWRLHKLSSIPHAVRPQITGWDNPDASRTAEDSKWVIEYVVNGSSAHAGRPPVGTLFYYGVITSGGIWRPETFKEYVERVRSEDELLQRSKTG